MSIAEREREHFSYPVLSTTIKAAGLGFIIGELAYPAWYLFEYTFDATQYRLTPFILLWAEIAVASLIAIDCTHRVAWRYFRKLIVSCRIDLLSNVLVGVAAALLFPIAESTIFLRVLLSLTAEDWLYLAATPLALVTIIAIRSRILTYKKPPESAPAFFVNDLEKTASSEDLLQFKAKAERFAERALNGGSSDSMVFGIDAPWGTGKSTFVNFCIERWRKQTNPPIIIYRFNPLQYDDRRNLLQKFIDGLVITVRENVFVPELRPIVSRYAKLVSAKKPLSFAGFELTLNLPEITLERATADLHLALASLKGRLMVIVDDLDRMEFSAIKDILFVIKKGFSLPNISFVLCYDVHSIGALEAKSFSGEKISEFLEKFINVKIGLYPSSVDLQRYITENLKDALAGNLLADFRLLDEALAGLREIYAAPNYYRYAPLIGDIRKIKRLINLLMVLDLGETDFKNSDLDQRDLLNLLLLYINYPALFRDIYNAETEGRSGIFSLVISYGQNAERRHYENSVEYLTLIKDLTDTGRQTEKFLLDQIFGVATRLSSTEPASIDEEALHIYACFNDKARVGGRNLERYLALIVRVSRPPATEQYSFYVNTKDEFLGGKALATIFESDEFAAAKGEFSHEQLWRVLVNASDKFDSSLMSQLILYVIENIDRYSTVESKKLGALGLRYSNMPYTLLKLLDVGGWHDSTGRHRDNSDQNVRGITDWIYGEGDHEGKSILASLFNARRGILGLHDLMIFRLYCCADRGGSFFNLTRALALHHDSGASTTGLLSRIVIDEMREISQTIFAMFKEHYIAPRKCLFAEGDRLTPDQLMGESIEFVRSEIAAEKYSNSELQSECLTTITSVKSFIVYQLTNIIVDTGVGCGFYDAAGKDDAKGIFGEMNAYLFEVCFNPEADSHSGYEIFLDYLLASFRSQFMGDGERRFKLQLDEICQVLDRDRLRNYWETHCTSIREQNYERKDKKVFTVNYTASYADDLESAYLELDTLLADQGRSL